MGIDIAADRKEKQIQEEATRTKEIKKQKLSKGLEAFKEGFRGTGFICTQCGTTGKPKTITKGNIFVEAFLWLFGLAFCWFFLISLVFPIVYSIWRHLSRFKGCPECQGNMIGTDTPIGKKLMNK